MFTLRTSLLALLALPAVVSPVTARDVQLGLPSLQLNVAAASVGFAPQVVLAASSATSASAREGAPAAPSFEADARPRRQLTGAGYGLAAGLGLLIGGLVLAVQTRPRGEFSDGVCYDDPETEKRFLYVGTGVMGAGITLSMGMVAWLIGLRRAHPELRPSARTRGLQALTGFGVAGVTSTFLMSFTVGCSSS